MEVKSKWNWRRNRCEAYLVDVIGSKTPPRFFAGMQHNPIKYQKDSKVWQHGEQLGNYLHSILNEPKKLEIGTKGQFLGHNGQFDSIERNGSRIRMLTHKVYDPLPNIREWDEWEIDTLPPHIQLIIKQIETLTNNDVSKDFFEIFGGGELDPEKWKGKKKQVFISYRGDKRELALELSKKLGEYGNFSHFVPRTDFLDLQAGDWFEQLMQLIKECDIFIPLLTDDYLNGPVSKIEFDEAFKHDLRDEKFTIIPVLIEGRPSDYSESSISHFHMIKAPEGFSEEKIEEIAYLCLKIPRNPFL